MNIKKNIWKVSGICYLISAFLVHYIELFTVSGAVFLHRFEVENSLMIYCLAGMWSDKNIIVLFCLGMYIGIVAAYILALVFILKDKYQFFMIPLVIFIVDIIFLITVFLHNAWGIVGIIYKLIGCLVFFQACKFQKH